LHPGCNSQPDVQPVKDGTYHIPYQEGIIGIDGILDESAYQKNPPFTDFVVAADSLAKAPETKAWLFWSDEYLYLAYDCLDSTPATASPTSNEKDVDGQDRVELFIWSGDPKDTYYCFEIAGEGALHDYSAQFYRKMNTGWSSVPEFDYQVLPSPLGYTVEARIAKSALEQMGHSLTEGSNFRIGLFRADYDQLDGTPTWITWIDYGGKPDFHIEESFGTAELLPINN